MGIGIPIINLRRFDHHLRFKFSKLLIPWRYCSHALSCLHIILSHFAGKIYVPVIDIVIEKDVLVIANNFNNINDLDIQGHEIMIQVITASIV